MGNRDSTQELYDKLIECFDINTPDGQNFNICPGLGNPEEQTRFNLATANANVEAAQARLDALLAGPDADAVAIAQASLAAASAQFEAAQANHELLLKGASAAQIVAAEAALAQAQANLDALIDGPSAAQVAAAEVAVEQARISLQRAERDLAEATLVAPFDGVITAVSANIGETVNGIVITIVDESSLEVVLSVDEVDIGDIAIGQPASITLETWPDTVLQGQVASIAPSAAQDNSAVVSFKVYLSLGETDLPVRVGMTANADLRTNNYENVLLAPNAAINVDRSRGIYSVNRVTTDADGNETIEVVEVTIGLRDGDNTQIIDGLQDGDVLLVGNVAPVFEFGSGPPPGAEGGGGPFGGG